MEALVVAPYFPYPPTQGGVYDTWNRLRSVADLCEAVDVIATVKPAERPTARDFDVVAALCRHVEIVERRNRPLDMFSTYPLQCRSRLRESPSLDLSRYGVVFWETHYTLGIFIRHRRRFRPDAVHYLRVQNDEQLYFMALARADRRLRSVYYLAEAARFRLLERRAFPRLTALLHISDKELEDYRGRYPMSRNIFLPAALNVEGLTRPAVRHGGTVLFCGSLFMPNNLDALRWYLAEVHPILTAARSAYRLVVAGNTKGTMPAWIAAAAARWPNVELHDTPQDLFPLYARAAVSVNPMREGTGVKLKTLDALIHGVPIVSTPTGIEGTALQPGVHALVASDAAGFVSAIQRLLDEPALGIALVERGQEWLRRTYDQHGRLSELLGVDAIGEATESGSTARIGRAR